MATLRQMTNIQDVYRSAYFQKHFIQRYMNNISRMAFEIFDTTPTHQQIEVFQSHDFIGGRTVVPSGHGTGKTRSIGVLAAAFLLLLPNSITRIIAPREKQVTSLVFKEVKFCLNSLLNPIEYKGELFPKEWAFLHKFIKFTKTKIYIKGLDETWYIEPATAPKGSPENISGQHNFNYFLILEEMSGIDDELIANALGALTQKVNSCIGFSQHTKLHGKFHDFTQNDNWNTIRLNSLESPLVGDKEIENWNNTYDENEKQVKVRGLQPHDADGSLIGEEAKNNLFSKKLKPWLETIVMNNRIYSIDISYAGVDSSVISDILGTKITDKNGVSKNYYIVKDIEVYAGRNKKRPTEISERAAVIAYENNSHSTHHYIHLPIDATAGGDEAYLVLDNLIRSHDMEAEVRPIRWGSARLLGQDKIKYFNQRAKAFVELKNAMAENRIFCESERYKQRILQEIMSIEFEFTPNAFKYKIIGKDKMKKSPDILDTFAQAILVDMYECDSDIDGLEYIQNHSSQDEDEEIFEDEELDMELFSCTTIS